MIQRYVSEQRTVLIVLKNPLRELLILTKYHHSEYFPMNEILLMRITVYIEHDVIQSTYFNDENQKVIMEM